MKQCPLCKTEYSNNEMYCPKDNYRLLKISDQNNTVGVTGVTKLICPRCKTQYDTSVEKCTKCDLYLTTKKSNQNSNIYNNTHKQPNSANIPKCPTCGSTNIKRISTLNRSVSVGTLGLLSGKIGKNYECLNCKAKW